MDSLQSFKTFVDVAYRVHPDYKSFSGGLITFGNGIIYAKSSKQKINVKSSTKGKVVGASDFLPFHIWYKHFMEEQGYNIGETMFYQDNSSTIKIKNDGWISCGKQSKHINIHYLFLKDCLAGNHIKVQYCPTTKMLTDFLTKPLQGSYSQKFCDLLMGRVHISTLLNEPVPDPPSKECVGGHSKGDIKPEECTPNPMDSPMDSKTVLAIGACRTYRNTIIGKASSKNQDPK